MTPEENKTNPLAVRTVLIRRGSEVIGDFPTKDLIAYIKSRRLRRSDEISGDGSQWLRLDQHKQLEPYFPREQETPSITPISEPPAQKEFSPTLPEVSNREVDEPTSSPNPSPSLKVKNELERLAKMLSDIND